ncbi:hypothetical protein [Kocuria sp.]|uniref:hypothetical protein n=1 Tax=Kocuria sp. TaxID=1871328 RepID=UPI0026DC83FE|nr:hypothetical protein [Kocuria sp.]MDO4919640.1 hypothetical protein [Kocuria sp.]
MTMTQMQETVVPTTGSGPAGVLGAGCWTGMGSDATFTWVHTPENGRVRGLVVIAPPVGREHVQSYRAVRQLAMLLAGAGYCVARVAYRGVGDSHALTPADDLPGVWRSDILAATAQARELCGVQDLPVHAIGYRVGAALLAGIAQEFDHVIAWEPVGGATFVNQWSRLRRATLPEIPVGEGVDLMGLWLTEDQAAGLAGLPDPRRMRELPPNVEVYRETSQPRAKVMYGVESLDVRVHYDVLEDLLWRFPRSPLHPLTGDGRGPTRNEFQSPGGVACAEEIVQVSPRGYPGVLTGPVAAAAAHAPGASGESARDGVAAGRAPISPWPGKPVTFFAPGASEPRDGSALWSETARRLAGQGVASLRADRDGAGDRALLWSDRDPNPYRYLNAQALREQAQWLTEVFPAADVVATVLCSGAWATLRAAREPEGIAARSLILINQNEWRMRQAFFDELRHSYDGDATLRARAAAADTRGAEPARTRPHPATASVKRLLGHAGTWTREGLTQGRRTASALVHHHTPERVWNLMGRCPAASIPDHVLDRASRDRDVVLLVGPQDEARYRETTADRAVNRLQRRGRHIVDRPVAGVDHSVLSRTARDEIARQLDELFTQWKAL